MKERDDVGETTSSAACSHGDGDLLLRDVALFAGYCIESSSQFADEVHRVVLCSEIEPEFVEIGGLWRTLEQLVHLPDCGFD